jgi:hypothetical protein
MPPESDIEEIKRILAKNQVLLEEHNLMLARMYRYSVYGFWFRIVWYVILIGLPFALYFYVLEPYFIALGSSYEVFNTGLQEIPGWKQLLEAFKNI